MFLLALPVLGEQFCNILVGLVDTFLAGRISKEAISAVGLASYVGWLASMLSGFIGVGATALVARCWGARDHRQANHVTNQAMGLAGIWGCLMTLGLFCLAGTMPALMGLTAEANGVARHYLRVDAAGQFFFAYLLIGAACLRGAGDTRTPMLVMIAVNIVNVLVSCGLVLGIGPLPRLGVTGIVTGTVTARIFGGVLMLIVLFRGRRGLRLDLQQMKPQAKATLRILRIGGPAGLDSAIMWAGQFVFLTFIAHAVEDPDAGTAAYAAHMVGVRVLSLSYLPATAWAVAAATLVGQALGAGDPRRARRTGHIAVLQLLPFSLFIALVYYCGAALIYQIWSNDPLVHLQGVPMLRLGAIAQPSLIAMIIYLGALRGAGDTRYPLFFSILGVLVVRLPVGYLFGVTFKGGLVALWIGVCCDLLLRSLLALGRFSLGGWTRRSI